MSTSSGPGRSDQQGFTALELVVGMTLTVILALGAAPLLLSLQGVGVCETDRTVVVLQGRVAAARLERDLRMASAEDTPFAIEGPILEATSRQLVFLGRSGGTSGLSVIEWELSGFSLMRRWGPCPSLQPESFSHTLYVDNKSMLEGLSGDARFEYVVCGSTVTGVADSELALIEGVVLRGSGRDGKGDWHSCISASARVGR